MIDLSPYSVSTQVLALCHYSGVTPRMFEALMRHFGNLQQVFDAGPGAFATIDGISRRAADRLDLASTRLPEAETFEKSLIDRDIAIVNWFDETYPHLLTELHDPPPIFFYRGALPSPDRRTVALVGAEAATAEGIEMTTRLAKEFAQNEIQIVSSLHGGIDTAAHLAARSVGGATFAVLDSGIESIDGPEGIPVAIDVLKGGGVIFEYAPEVEPTAQTASEANRLIVGLSQAVVVTEAYADSQRVLDIIKSCHEIGKLLFFMVDPQRGAHADERSLKIAMDCGAIPIEGYDKLPDIMRSLV